MSRILTIIVVAAAFAAAAVAAVKLPGLVVGEGLAEQLLHAPDLLLALLLRDRPADSWPVRVAAEQLRGRGEVDV